MAGPDQQRVSEPSNDERPPSDGESIQLQAGGGEADGTGAGGSAGRDPKDGDADDQEGEWQTVGEKKKQQQQQPRRDGAGKPSSSPAAPQRKPQADESDSDSDDDDDSDEEGERVQVQLGFAEPLEPGDQKRLLFLDPDWHDWDGGKIGGKPIWLNPRELPSRAMLDCAGCGDPLSFILQIYCPLDEQPGAFHRALYVFCCRKPRCTGPGCAKVLRCQLPRANPFYAHEPKRERASDRSALAAKTCDVCGQGADKSCAGCKRAGYCSRAHQKEAWKAGHKAVCSAWAGAGAEPEATGGEDEEPGLREEAAAAAAVGAGGSGGADAGGWTDPSQLRSVLPEYEIVIEEEPGSEGEGRSAEERKREDEALLRKYQDVYVADTTAEDEEDARLAQRDLDRAAGADPGLKDRQSLRFLATIGREPDQVLRYARWQARAPLWVATEGQPPRAASASASAGAEAGAGGGVAPCERCGAPRAFEFQVMPQLLHYLRVDAAAQLPGRPGEACRLGAMDWGTLAAYTCTKSCDGPREGAYVEEVLWRQQPMA